MGLMAGNCEEKKDDSYEYGKYSQKKHNLDRMQKWRSATPVMTVTAGREAP
jgi:hypothetical protein